MSDIHRNPSQRKCESNQTGGGRLQMFLTLSNTLTVFYLFHCSLWGFLLASTCLFCWMLWNTDISLKYWIRPRLGCELCLPVKEQASEREREKEGEREGRWDPWINCYQFVSFTGQSEACNAGWNWILVVVKHHQSKQCERLKVRNHFGQHGTCRMFMGRNWSCAIISKCGTTVLSEPPLLGCWSGRKITHTTSSSLLWL